MKMALSCSTHGETRNAYKILIGRLEGKRPPWRPRHRWKVILGWILGIG